MPPSWDSGLLPKERTNLIRRLHRVWASDLALDELVDEMAICLRCRFRPGTAFGCDACRGDPDKLPACRCGGTGFPRPCDLCGARGVMAGWTVEIIVAMAVEIGLPPPEERKCECYIPTEAEIRLAKQRMKMRWSIAQIEASLRGTIPSEGDSADASESQPRKTKGRPDADRRKRRDR